MDRRQIHGGLNMLALDYIPSTSVFSGRVGLSLALVLLWLWGSMMETCMLLAEVRLHDHRWTFIKAIGVGVGVKKQIQVWHGIAFKAHGYYHILIITGQLI